MKILNVSLFLLPFLIALIITIFVSVPGVVSIFSYFIILGMVLGGFILADFLFLYLQSKKQTVSGSDKELLNLKIAVLVTAFNEDPKLVLDTSLSAKLAVGKQGHVFILDDSTDEDIKKQIDKFKEYGFKVVRREKRKGYKAGAVNDWLNSFGHNYDLMAIFDADQRPMPFIFNKVTPCFVDEKVAFVQVPQYYSEISSGISLGAFYQQLPFLRLIMRGRSNANSAFSLGSGTIYRIKALNEINGLDDSTVTEDISTALDLHSRGWKSIYIDEPLVWYGMPPKNIAGYWLQQGRWSLGGFQLLSKILKTNLSVGQFFDYYTGWLYWLLNGPVGLYQVFAPVIFLIFHVYFFSWNPIVYLAAYIPYFLMSLSFYLFAVKEQNYGARGFVYHHTVQLMACVSVTSSFIGWILKKKRPFAVTPKGENTKTPIKILFTYSTIICILSLAIIKGIFELTTVNFALLAANAVNIFWATYFIIFFSFGGYMISHSKPSNELKISIKPSYLSSSEKARILSLVHEAIIIEEKISEIYLQLSQKIGGEDGSILNKCSSDSAQHARIFNQILSWIDTEQISQKTYTPSAQYIEILQKFTPYTINKINYDQTVELLHLMLDVENMFNEELYVELLVKIYSETLIKQTSKYQEIHKLLEKVKLDEEHHSVQLRTIRDKYLKTTFTNNTQQIDLSSSQ